RNSSAASDVYKRQGLPSMGGGGRSFTETNSLAVLPFANMSSDPEQEYFSDGLTEELLSALTKIRELKVTGRTSSFSFKGKNEDLRVIGRQLGVANILEGSVRKAGNRVRITAQLVNTEDGFHLWSETYDRTLDDIFAVQDDIAKSVAQELQVTLLGRSAPGGMPNVDAFDLVLQARFVLQARHEEAIRRGRAMLERALQVCPEYAPAWAEMSLVHSREYERATRVEDKQRILEQRRRTLARALEIDPNMAVAHSRMASVQRDCWDFAGAALSTEKALAADPKNPIVLGNASSQYAALGRFEEAIALGLRAQQSDPLNILLLFNVGLAYMAAGRLESAEGQFRRLVELNSDYGPVYR
ncbi:MAG: hypothetical protein QUU85_19855, partial [Candidatus Eisenbacteria bacterium]|nr:hypothetical protein [Candidatus Eisenbacteria bacterium]